MPNFKTLLILPCFAFFSANTMAQNAPKKQIDLGIEGMMGVSHGSKTLGINVGGPSLKLKIKNFKFGVGCFPSLIIVDGKAFPKLAVSPIVEYKKIVLITPYYGYDSKEKAIWTFGLGYQFF
jgi:hypothetical protein